MAKLDTADNDLVAEIHKKLDGLIVAATELRAEHDAALARVKALEAVLKNIRVFCKEVNDPLSGTFRHVYSTLQRIEDATDAALAAKEPE